MGVVVKNYCRQNYCIVQWTDNCGRSIFILTFIASSFLCFLHPLFIPPFPVVLKTPIDSPLHWKKLQLIWPLLTSTCSALIFSNGYSFQIVPCRPPWLPHASFPPSICHIYSAWFRVVIGFILCSRFTLIQDLICDFYPSDQRFARGLVNSPHLASFGFHLAMDTLAFCYILRTTGRIWDLYP